MEKKSINENKKGLGISFYFRLFVFMLFFAFCSVSAVWVAKNPIKKVATPGQSEQKVSDSPLKSFSSYEELLAFMEENESSNGLRYDYSYAMKELSAVNMLDTNVSTDSAAAMGVGGGDVEEASSPQVFDEYSQTNVQVQGVDEGDLVKTDGDYIYIVSGNEVLITKSLPAEETEIVSRIEMEYSPSGLYLSGDKLVVYGSNYPVMILEEYSNLKIGRNNSYASLTVYNISDRSNPQKEKEYEFEGNYRDSRMLGDYIYFITATNPVFAYYDKEQPVPYILEDGEVMVRSVMPNVYYFDFSYNYQNFTSISSLNLNDLENGLESDVYVLDGYQNNLFVSENNIYITFSKYVSEDELVIGVIKDILVSRLSSSDQAIISEIEGVSENVLSSSEKVYKIISVFEKYAYSLSESEQRNLQTEIESAINSKYDKIAGEMQRTLIHKIGMNEGALEYKTHGEVSGNPLNQFSMNEQDGYFMIATTVGRNWSSYTEDTESYNNLYILDEDMQEVGALEDIAEGEEIYSVRFMQNRAYMVTFERVDPLFVIDTSDPTNPQILGELKVPGYSTYLHPYDDNLLIGLGRNADEEGRTIDGVKISLFDASDVTNPREIDTYILGGYGSDSVALSDHRAFLFSKDKNLLVIPAVLREQSSDDSWSYTVSDVGSAVFNITESGFEYRGFVSHFDNKESYSYLDSYYYYNSGAFRNLYIGDNLYSISDNYLKVNSILDLSEIKSVDLIK